MSYPLVSIIIPCYNAAQWVGEAIDSALAQTYSNKEVIVIDDGSTDSSLNVIQSFGYRIRWETGPNRGACAARNRGLEMATGSLIQFLDADDGLYPTKLALQVPVLVSEAVEVVTCEWGFEGSNKRVFTLNGKDPIVRIEDPVKWTLAEKKLGVSSPLHKIENLRSVHGFCEELPCAQEYDLHIRLACVGLSFGHMRECLWYARQRNGSVSSDYRRVLLQEIGIFRRAKSILETRAALSEEREHALADACVRAGVLLFRLGDQMHARVFMAASTEFHKDGGSCPRGGIVERILYPILGPLGVERVRQMKHRFMRQ